MRQPVLAGAAPDSEGDVNLTPMLDIVFIMLIFFLVTASFLREAGIPVDPPEPTKSPTEVAESILIRINDKSQIWMGERLIDWRAVRANITRAAAEQPGSAVVIQSDPAAKNRVLVHVMDASRQAGVYDIALAEAAE